MQATIKELTLLKLLVRKLTCSCTNEHNGYWKKWANKMWWVPSKENAKSYIWNRINPNKGNNTELYQQNYSLIEYGWLHASSFARSVPQAISSKSMLPYASLCFIFTVFIIVGWGASGISFQKVGGVFPLKLSSWTWLCDTASVQSQDSKGSHL